MRAVIILGFILLFILHQDFWLWNDRRLVFGFLPIGLAYHAGFSIASSLLWGVAVWKAWPREYEELVAEATARQPEPAQVGEGTER
jgi:hypothetical protein